MNLKEFLKAVLASIVDIKHQLVLISTVLFYLGKMSEVGWITFVLSVTGFRLATEFMDAVKEVKALASIDLKKE